MWLSLLGPLHVRHDGGDIAVPAAKQRIVLAALLTQANRVVSAAQLTVAIWNDTPPPAAGPTLRNYVKRLRGQLGPEVGGRILTRYPGYQIGAGPAELDLLKFGQLLSSAGASVRAGRWEQAGAAAAEALGLCRGTPLADIPSEVLHREEVPRLEQMYVQAVEWRQEAQLRLGRAEELVPQLRALITQHPWHERFHAQLMLAYYRCGRQAEALAVYQEARRAFRAELGVEPGAELRELQRQILAADPALLPRGTAAVSGGPASAWGRGGPAGPVPRQLPPPPPFFTGRRGELAALDAALGQAGNPAQTVVITAIGGSAGVGKTALALYWAHQAAGQFPDGQLYVNLRGFDPSGEPVTPADALRGFLDAFHLAPAAVPAGQQARAGLYRSLLAGRRMLIVLDNARDAEQVRPLLPGGNGSLVLITSRNRLTGLVAAEGARPVALGLFTEAEAAQLLAWRLGPQRLAAEPAAVADLIRLCARLPLAVSIAAARAAMSPPRPLAAIAGELAAARLDGLATGEVATDIRAAFAWSCHGLTESAARLFWLLGMHPGPDISEPAAASLARVPLPDARKMLAELAETQLIQDSPEGRFAAHDLLRSYAAEQAAAHLAGPETQAAVGRMLDHYLGAACAADRVLDPLRPAITVAPAGPAVTAEPAPGYEAALAWFKAEHRVLTRAVMVAAERGFGAHAWQLAWALTTYFNRRGHWQDWVGLQRLALRSARRIGDADGQAHAHNDLGRACLRLGDRDEALHHQRKALALFGRLGDDLGLARTHIDLGRTFSARRRYDLALDHAGWALRQAESAGSEVIAAGALNNIGWYHACLGNHAQTLRYCHRALAIFDAIGSRDGAAQTLDSIGYAYHRLGQPGEAVSHYQRALRIFSGRAVGYDQAYLLGHLGAAQRAAGQPDEARDTWGQALVILDDLHHPDAAQVRAWLGELAGRDPAQATQTLPGR